MDSTKQCDQSSDIWWLFGYTCRSVNYYLKKELRQLGLSYEIAATLCEIATLGHNPMPIELSRKAKRKPQTTTNIINRMDNQGLIRKSIDKQRKNTYRIYLTEKGLIAYQGVKDIDFFYTITNRLSEEKLEHFRECLEEILIQVNKLSKEIYC
jgi:DNA-binding MarR family transcriptional regulator